MTSVRTACLLALLVATCPTQAATITLAPTDDTTVYSFQPDTNYGSVPALGAGGVFNGSEQYVAYLRFDLGGIPAGQTITGATLNMFQFLGGGFAPIGSSIYRVANDGWTEDAVTWNSPPAAFANINDSTRIGSNANAGTTYRGWSQWDLLANGQWDAALDLADGVLSIAAYSNAYSGTQTHNWCSKESDLANCLISGETPPVDGLRRPYLDITYVPLPGALWLAVTAALALIPRIRRR